MHFHSRSFFNKATVLLSVAINAVMLATWESQGSLGQPVIDDIIEATNDVPDVVYKWVQYERRNRVENCITHLVI